jgi:uncharacterized protein VirK/YbjX
MVLAYLARHWMARRHYPLKSWSACVARSLRVLLFYRTHARLVSTEIYRDYVVRAHDDVFNHLSHRNYLTKDLSLRERVQRVLVHYRFEQDTFDAAYKHAVYCGDGLPLWRHEADGRVFEIRLQMACRLNAEGDLTLIALADGKCLHRLSFSWVDGAFAGVDLPILPFAARNQGYREDGSEALAAFEQAFPHNSPSFFCFAALNGVAQALGMNRIVGVKSTCQSAYAPSAEKHFSNAYDGFWQTLGGVDTPGRVYEIALPLQLRPLSETPAKHRKRSATRREHWARIAESARCALLPHLVPARANAGAGTVREALAPLSRLMPEA